MATHPRRVFFRGYEQALSTIVDANVTTLIAAIVLFNFGTGPIKGFAVTLSIGILTSMFTSIMVTRGLGELCLRQQACQGAGNLGGADGFSETRYAV